ncbi:hypothetical protein MAPG_09488 [Magnaporthiopsis poae ATCC 64411]|uniref:Programmed cell death protein 2 C-terminal domain-containing protein n=1 Tax=Magnaporthiopsis poae (strain ATCC 64411 / 73-15) TaxID=644358 RepID=A0A0C4EA33_MAGP6|nr:hypothetical protein MAPG_09488 [Magnaporthiopsis poae ATCC 64411]
MVSYDSDSSGEDEQFTETNVLLGYTSKDAGSETVSRLGGRPDWLVADKPPTAALARCKVCKDLTVLLLQLNGELPERFPGHERRLYVFACRKKSCRRQAGSVRAIRGLKVSGEAAAAAERKQAAEKQKAAAAKEASKPVASTGLGESLFGVKAPAGGAGGVNPFAAPAPGANPFSSAPQASAANPFSTKPAGEGKKQKEEEQKKEESKTEKAAAELPQTFAEKLALNNPQVSGPPPAPEPWPAESEPGQPRPYPVSWIAEAEYETLDPWPMPAVPTGPTAMELDEEEVGSGSGGKGKGKGKEDKEAIVDLEDGDEDADVLDGMDWGTIIVGVCSRDCQERTVGDGEAGYLEEWAGVQWEELMVKR